MDSSNPTGDLFPELLSDTSNRLRPAVSGQCAQVLELIRKNGLVLSFILTADFAIPEAAARGHDLRAKGFNVLTSIKKNVLFRGKVKGRAAFYSVGVPEWPRPGFVEAEA